MLVRLEGKPNVYERSDGVTALRSEAASKLQRVLGIRAQIEIVPSGTFPRTDFKARRVIDDREIFREFMAKLQESGSTGRRGETPVPSLDLVDRVLAGETPALARLLSRVEQGMSECQPALNELYRHTGSAHIVGVTGVPGSGKSTLITKLVLAIRQSGRKAAVLAVDPSSPFSGGAILGDRIRMTEWSRPRHLYPQHGYARRDGRSGARNA